MVEKASADALFARELSGGDEPERDAIPCAINSALLAESERASLRKNLIGCACFESRMMIETDSLTDACL